MRPLSLPDEGRYVGVALEMLRSGNWLTPTLDGLPFFHKPPLFYWITAASMDLFGPTEWAARTASILAGSVTISVLYSTLREWLGERPARMAVVVLATQPLFFGGAQFANMDMLVAGCIATAILFGARAALNFEDERERRGDLAKAYIAAAFGVLAKGLIGLALPGLVLLLWLGLMRRWRTVRALLWTPGWAMFMVIVAPWFMATQWDYPSFFHYFFVVQHLERFSGGGFNNVQPLWFYVPVLFLATLPWSGWWLVNLRKSMTVTCSRSAILALTGVWLGVVLVFFSIPESKLVGYVLPALVPLAILVALTAGPLIERSARAATLWHASTATAAVLCIAIAIGFAVARPKSSRSLSLALLEHREFRGGLAFIDEYRYDVPFYLHDTTPIRVVSSWDPVQVRQHDNWRRELADAGVFAPGAATDRLVSEAEFRSDICSGRVRWVMARLDSEDHFHFLGSAQQVAKDGLSALWYLDVRSDALVAGLGCHVVNDGRPNGAAAHTGSSVASVLAAVVRRPELSSE
jgi:hypothetical protein